MKKLLKGLLVAAMALTVTACGGNSNDSANETKTITVGISPDYAPYESLTKDNEIVGFDVDMVALFEQYLTEEEGVTYKLEFKQMDFEGKNLVAQTGATGETAAKEVKDAKVTGLKNVQDIMNALAANQYDAAIVDLGVAKNYVTNGEFTMIEESLLDEKNYIIAKEGNTEIIAKMNKCIAKFIASDDYNKLCTKYDLSPLEE